MYCILSFIILSIMGIFSATHRKWARESLSCAFRRVTFRACDTGFSDKTRALITGKLLKRSVFLAKIFSKYFEVLSWIFFLVMLASFLWFVRGVYNFYAFGSCQGLNESGFCVFDPTGANNKITSIGGKPEECTVDGKPIPKNLVSTTLSLSEYPNMISVGADNKVIFIGCYSCDYTRKTYPLIKEMLAKNKIDYTFVHFSVKKESDYLNDYVYCAYEQSPEKFWQFNDRMFASTLEQVASEDYTRTLMTLLGFDLNKIDACRALKTTKDMVEKQKKEVVETGIYGTPTIFINDHYFVGPKPYRVYRHALN